MMLKQKLFNQNKMIRHLEMMVFHFGFHRLENQNISFIFPSPKMSILMNFFG